MHAAQARHRRHDRLGDEDLYSVSRGAERRSEPYQRSHHNSGRAEPYGGSSTPQRSYADSPHGRVSDDWRVADPSLASSAHDRYRDDAVVDSRRDEYYDRPEGWGHRNVSHAQYPPGRREWAKRENHGYPLTSYTDGRSWGRSNRYVDSNRSVNGGEDWYHDGSRHERGRGRFYKTENFQSRDRDLRSRDDVVTGDAPRGRRSPYWANRTNEQSNWHREDRETGHDKDRDIPAEPDRTDFEPTRKWEPAASWKSKGKDDQVPARYERPDPPPPPQPRPGKKSGKNKKKGQQAFHKRDAKRDDNMNKYVSALINDWFWSHFSDTAGKRGTSILVKDTKMMANQHSQNDGRITLQNLVHLLRRVQSTHTGPQIGRGLDPLLRNDGEEGMNLTIVQ